jgi:hypothetical protein
MDLSKELSKKGADTAGIAAEVINNPSLIHELIEGVTASKGTLRYGFEKVLRLISETRPDLLYPFFDVFVDLLGHENSFIKWGAILTIANLTAVDSGKRFDEIFQAYYSLITGPVMVSAANVIRGSVKIALNRPELIDRIGQEILKVEKADYVKHGLPSPECRNVAIGHAIDTFDHIYDALNHKSPVVAFVTRQLKNSRNSVVKRSERFTKRHQA